MTETNYDLRLRGEIVKNGSFPRIQPRVLKLSSGQREGVGFKAVCEQGTLTASLEIVSI